MVAWLSTYVRRTAVQTVSDGEAQLLNSSKPGHEVFQLDGVIGEIVTSSSATRSTTVPSGRVVGLPLHERAKGRMLRLERDTRGLRVPRSTAATNRNARVRSVSI